MQQGLGGAGLGGPVARGEEEDSVAPLRSGLTAWSDTGEHGGDADDEDEGGGGFGGGFGDSTAGNAGLLVARMAGLRNCSEGDERQSSLGERSEGSGAQNTPQLGPVQPLWKLVVEALFLAAESDDGVGALACLTRLRNVCRQHQDASNSSTKAPASSSGQSQTDQIRTSQTFQVETTHTQNQNKGSQHIGETEEDAQDLFAPIHPQDGAQAMQAIAALLFRAEDCVCLMDCLIEMDELNAELISAPGDGTSVDGDVDDAATCKDHCSVQCLFEYLDVLQGFADREVRRWAVKGLWRALHTCCLHERCNDFLIGLEAFEYGVLSLDHLTVQALTSNPADEVLTEVQKISAEKIKSSQLKHVLVRRAFAQSLLTRVIQLEQRGRKRGSRTSFALGSTGSQSGNSGNGNYSMGSGRREGVAFETGASSKRDSSSAGGGMYSTTSSSFSLGASAAGGGFSNGDGPETTRESDLTRRGTGEFGGRRGTGEFGGRRGTGEFGGRRGTGEFGGRRGTGEFGGRRGTGEFGGRRGTGDLLNRYTASAMNHVDAIRYSELWNRNGAPKSASPPDVRAIKAPSRRKTDLTPSPHLQHLHKQREEAKAEFFSRNSRPPASTSLGLTLKQHPRRQTELASVYARPGLERKSQMTINQPDDNLTRSRARPRISDMRMSELRGSEIRVSGLRSSRLAHLMMQARRSSMSFVGSVHTFRSEDLASIVRDGSALGLDANFQFPRLTDLSIPEHDMFANSDQRIWTSKNTSSQHWSNPNETGSSRGSLVAGIEYTDCATLLEIITGQIVEPEDSHSFQTTNPFMQHLSIAGQELIPVLLCMLGWMGDNLVRKEFIGSLFTLCASSVDNFQRIQSTDSWRTGLLRILQTIPRDRDFRDEASEFILHRVVELLCMSNFRLNTKANLGVLGLEQVLYETAVLSGWRKDSVGFVRSLLCAQADMLYVTPTPSLLPFFRIVENFLLFMPSREDALLGYANKWHKIARRAHHRHRRGRHEPARRTSLSGEGSNRSLTDDESSSLKRHQSFATFEGEQTASHSTGHRSSSALSSWTSGRPERLQHHLNRSASEEEDDSGESSSTNEVDDFDQNGMELGQGPFQFNFKRSKSDGSGDDDHGDEDDEGNDHEEDYEVDDNWLWEPVLGQCAPIEMAENQVDYLEFQLLKLRRGVDYGLHLDKDCASFADADFAHHMLAMLDRFLEMAVVSQEEIACLRSLRDRLVLLTEALDQAALDLESLREVESSQSPSMLRPYGGSSNRFGSLASHQESPSRKRKRLRLRRLIFNVQMVIIRSRVRMEWSCPCTYCQNMHLTDVAVERALDKMVKRSSALSVEDRLRNQCEHLVLNEEADTLDRPFAMNKENTDPLAVTLTTMLDASRICPLCKEHTLSFPCPVIDASNPGEATIGADDAEHSHDHSSMSHPVAQAGGPAPSAGMNINGCVIRLRPPSPQNVQSPTEGCNEEVVAWNGFAWHKKHLRCYTCSRVLDPNDTEDPPVIDTIAGCWPYCAECIEQLVSRCPACGDADPDVAVFPHHRAWHSRHLSCARCGFDTRLDSASSKMNLLLCEFHKVEEELPHCSACLDVIYDVSEAVMLEPGIYLHNSPHCLRCNCCHQELTLETARRSPLEKYKLLVFCDHCCETQYRPTCIVCMLPVQASVNRKVLVPTRGSRIDDDPIELLEQVRTGDDGRLRCHDNCCRCNCCGKSLHSDVCFVRPSADMSRYELYCEEDFLRIGTLERAEGGALDENVAVVTQLDSLNLNGNEEQMATSQGSPLMQNRHDLIKSLARASSSYEQYSNAEEDTEASGSAMAQQEQQEQQAQAVSLGTFLFINRSGVQQGPVTGEELYQLALSGSIDANTHVWTPGMMQWKPLSQLSQHSL